MKKIDLFIYDLDGTLVSSGDDLVNSINHTLNALNLDQKPKKEIIGFVGDGVRVLMERCLGQENMGFHEEAMRIFSDYYEKHLLDHTVLYPHVEDVLKNFAEKKKIILTNKRYEFTMMIARELKIDKYFTQILGIDSTPFSKPDRRLIDYVLDKHKSAREKTLMIGDGINDIIVAQKSGILSLGLLNGLGNRDDLLKLKADYYCEDILELNNLFC